MTYQRQQNDLNSITGQQFPSDAYKMLNSSANITAGSSTSTAYSLLSYFSRVNYKYDEKYLLTLSDVLMGHQDLVLIIGMVSSRQVPLAGLFQKRAL